MSTQDPSQTTTRKLRSPKVGSFTPASDAWLEMVRWRATLSRRAREAFDILASLDGAIEARGLCAAMRTRMHVVHRCVREINRSWAEKTGGEVAVREFEGVRRRPVFQVTRTLRTALMK